MKKIDLLFIPNNQNNYVQINDDFLEDIEIDCLKNILTTEEYDVFIRFISKPLINCEDIYERQNIFRDLMTYPSVLKKIKSICENAEKNKMPKYSRSNNSMPSKRRISEYLKVLNRNLDVQTELLAVVKERKFISSTMNKLRSQLDVNERINTLKDKFQKLVPYLLEDDISLQINFGNTFKLKSASVYSNGKRIIKKRIFHRNEAKGLPYGYDFIADLQIGEMLNSGIQNISYIIYQLNSYILFYCNDLLAQLTFYNAGIKLVKYLEDKGIKTVFPEITDNDYELKAKGLLDIGLILKQGSSKTIIPNDFNSKNDAFFLISGVNQGGKTTFLKSIGIAQLFAQNGLPIATNKYICPLFLSFVSHFPRGEDSQQYSGKLEEELSRFNRDLPLMKKKALILMNESFATTTEKEGAKIAYDTLRALSFVKPFVFFVTHNYIFLKNRNKYSLSFDKILLRSLITVKSDEPSKRTYKLEEGEPQEEINTIEFLMGKYIK